MRGTGTEQYCDRAVSAVSTGPLARGGAVERNHARAGGGRGPGRRHDGCARRCRRHCLGLDRPAGRTLPAVDAPEEDLARSAPHSVIMPAGKIAVEEVPHVKASCVISLGARPIANAVPCVLKSTGKSCLEPKTFAFPRKKLCGTVFISLAGVFNAGTRPLTSPTVL